MGLKLVHVRRPVRAAHLVSAVYLYKRDQN